LLLSLEDYSRFVDEYGRNASDAKSDPAAAAWIFGKFRLRRNVKRYGLVWREKNVTERDNGIGDAFPLRGSHERANR
jgi:hypothetical protein